MGKRGREQSTWSLVSHGKEFRFYSKYDEKLLKNMKQKNDVV